MIIITYEAIVSRKNFEMCAHMNVMSINGIVSQYSMTIIGQLRGDTPHKLSEQIKTIY